MVSAANGGRPRLPSGKYGVIGSTSGVYGTTRSISAKNSRLRLRLVGGFRAKSVFLTQIFVVHQFTEQVGG